MRRQIIKLNKNEVTMILALCDFFTGEHRAVKGQFVGVDNVLKAIAVLRGRMTKHERAALSDAIPALAEKQFQQ